MNSMLLTMGLIITIAALVLVYFLSGYLAPALSEWAMILIGSIAVVFGFLLGIKFMSAL